MSLLQTVQSYFRDSKLKKELQRKKGFSKKKVNLETAKSIGLLFDATRLDIRQTALQYAEQLKKQRKKVNLLGFFDVKQDPNASHSFPYFDKKSIDWTQSPKGDEVKYFLQQNFDIFVFLNPTTTPYSEYIAALTNAHFKVGPLAERTDCYDLMLNVNNKASLKHFIKHMEDILLKTNIEHEAA